MRKRDRHAPRFILRELMEHARMSGPREHEISPEIDRLVQECAPSFYAWIVEFNALMGSDRAPAPPSPFFQLVFTRPERGEWSMRHPSVGHPDLFGEGTDGLLAYISDELTRDAPALAVLTVPMYSGTKGDHHHGFVIFFDALGRSRVYVAMDRLEPCWGLDAHMIVHCLSGPELEAPDGSPLNADNARSAIVQAIAQVLRDPAQAESATDHAQATIMARFDDALRASDELLQDYGARIMMALERALMTHRAAAAERVSEHERATRVADAALARLRRDHDKLKLMHDGTLARVQQLSAECSTLRKTGADTTMATRVTVPGATVAERLDNLLLEIGFDA